MDKYIIFAENTNHSNFLFVRQYGNGFIVLSAALAHSKIFLQSETIAVAKAFKKCAEIDSNTIKIQQINRDTEREILKSLNNINKKSIANEKYKKQKYKKLGQIFLETKKRHIWLRRSDGNRIYYSCTKCPCIRISTKDGNLYILNKTEYHGIAPECSE